MEHSKAFLCWKSKWVEKKSCVCLAAIKGCRGDGDWSPVGDLHRIEAEELLSYYCCTVKNIEFCHLIGFTWVVMTDKNGWLLICGTGTMDLKKHVVVMVFL